jgi:hypothetical protein
VLASRSDRLFLATATLAALFGAYWSLSPIFRVESKVGSWNGVRELIASDPTHWLWPVALRFGLSMALIWLAMRVRPRRWRGYLFLLFTLPLTVFADLALLLEDDLLRLMLERT